MSANPTWKFELVRSSDMSLIRDLRPAATNRRLSLQLNKAGSFSFQVPIDSSVASDLALWSVGVLAWRNSSPIWSGAVVNIQDDAAAGTTQVNCTGWLDELDHRFVRGSEVLTLSFVDTIGGEIASHLVTTANLQTDSNDNPQPLHVNFGSFSDTQTRTRSYKAGDNYGQVLRELIEIENGFDIYVDPVTRSIFTRAPTSFIDRTGSVFGFGVEPHNLTNVTRTMDGTTLANRENVTTSGGVTVSQDDVGAIAAASVMLEEWLSLSDVGSAIIAGAYGAAELVYKRFGTITYQIAPRQYGNMLRPWDDYELGDQVYFNADRGRLKIESQGVRVFSLSIEIDDQGNEVVSELGVSP
jgi:hypothetical protein